MSLDWINVPCPNPDSASRDEAQNRQKTLTKPTGSLGRLEDIAIDFAAWQGRIAPNIDDILIRIFAADHGVCDQHVSAFPQEVTGQMISNFLSGGAAISVLADSLGADFGVINLGTITPLEPAPKLIDVQLAPSTKDFTVDSALTESQLEDSLNIGREEILSSTNSTNSVFIGGDMGIGNTCASSAIYSAVFNLPGALTVGPGTGVSEEQLAHKATVIDKGLALHQPLLGDPLGVLRCLGGFEIAALTGAYITAAQHRVPSIIDGFICTAAALIACKINPSCRAWMMFSHKSAEPAHILALEELDATPLLDLNMRLGEGSGAAMVVPLIQNALLLHANMATFNTAGVSDRDA